MNENLKLVHDNLAKIIKGCEGLIKLITGKKFKFTIFIYTAHDDGLSVTIGSTVEIDVCKEYIIRTLENPDKKNIIESK